MHGQFRSAVFTLASGAPVRIGFDRPRGRAEAAGMGRSPVLRGRHGWYGAREGSWIAYTHRIPIPTLDVHAIDRYLWIGSLLGFDDEPPDLAIYLSAEPIRNVERLLAAHGAAAGTPAVVLGPGTMWWRIH